MTVTVKCEAESIASGCGPCAVADNKGIIESGLFMEAIIDTPHGYR